MEASQPCSVAEAVESLHDSLIMVSDTNAEPCERAHAKDDLLVVRAAIDQALARAI
jgi:hypothetical protein